MKFTETIAKKRTAARLALVAAFAGFLPSLAQAQLVVPATPEQDVIVAFRDIEDKSSGAYLVNIGPLSQFVGAAPGSTQVATTVTYPLGTDLVAAYNRTVDDNPVQWYNRPQVAWAAFVGDANYYAYISKSRPSIPGPRYYNSNIVGAHARINSVISQGYNELFRTASNPRGGFQSESALAGNYFNQVDSPTGAPVFTLWSSIEQTFSGGVNSAIDFYVYRRGPGPAAVTPSNIEHLGYFTINASGVISFTKAAVDPFTIDTDGDGFSDGEEDLAGTGKNNPTSFPKLDTPVRALDGNSVTLVYPYPTVSGNQYKVQYTPDFVVPWTDITAAPEEIGGTLRFIDNDPARTGQPKGFYRLVIQNP